MDMTRHYHDLYGDESKDQKIKRLYTEIEQLREALEKIANGYSDEDGMRNIARSALQQKDVSQMTHSHTSHAQMSDDKGQQ